MSAVASQSFNSGESLKMDGSDHNLSEKQLNSVLENLVSQSEKLNRQIYASTVDVDDLISSSEQMIVEMSSRLDHQNNLNFVNKNSSASLVIEGASFGKHSPLQRSCVENIEQIHKNDEINVRGETSTNTKSRCGGGGPSADDVYQNTVSYMLKDIEKESQQIETLKAENRELHATLKVYETSMALIMTKYRQHITALMDNREFQLVDKTENKCSVVSSSVENKSSVAENICEAFANLSTKQSNDEDVKIRASQLYGDEMESAVREQKCQKELMDKEFKMNEMVRVMTKSIEIDDVNHALQEQIRTKLITENRGLRDMLKISKDYESLHFVKTSTSSTSEAKSKSTSEKYNVENSKDSSLSVDKGCQTEPVVES